MSAMSIICARCFIQYVGFHDCNMGVTLKMANNTTSRMDTEKELEAADNAYIVQCLMDIFELTPESKHRIISMVVQSLIKGGGRDFIK